MAFPASATLEVEPPPIFTKGFAPSSILAGFASMLTFSIDNTASSLGFTDNLPVGVIIATSSNLDTSCTGGTLTGLVGGSTIISTVGVP